MSSGESASVTPERRDLYVWPILAAILIEASVFRLTSHQPLWWDEAEYLLKAKSLALGTPATGFYDVRPLGFPILAAGFFATGLGEFGLRVFLCGLTVACVPLVQRLGSRIGDPTTGLVAAIVFATHYLVTFFSGRTMVELPHTFLVLLAFERLTSRARWSLEVSAVALALAALTRFPAAIMIPIGLFWVVLGKGRTRREIIRATIVGALAMAPYFVWAQIKHGNALHGITGVSHLVRQDGVFGRLSDVLRYVLWLASSLGPVGSLALIGGLWVAVSGLETRTSTLLPLLIWFVAPLVFFGATVNHWEDRYVILSIPAAGILIGLFVSAVGARFADRVPRMGLILAAAFSIIFASTSLRHGFEAIRNSSKSYLELQLVGEWLRTHTPPETTVISVSGAQLTYYSERPSRPIPETERELWAILANPNHVLVTSGFEEHPDWMQGLDPARFQPLVAAPTNAPMVVAMRVRTSTGAN